MAQIGYTTVSGSMSRTRAAATSALYCPTVEVRAHSWRLMLDTDTVSWSTSVNVPTPLRARHSAA